LTYSTSNILDTAHSGHPNWLVKNSYW